MRLNDRERVARAIAHQDMEIVPWHFDLTTVVVRKLATHWGIAPDYWEVEGRAGGHLYAVGAKGAGDEDTAELGHDLWRDEFGTVWRRDSSTLEYGDWGGLVDFPLKSDSLEGYQFPSPGGLERYSHLAQAVAEHPTKWVNFVLRGIFDFGWHLRGFENLLADLVANPGFVHELLDRCLEHNLGVIDQLRGTGLDGVLFIEDWGSQKGLLMGARAWRRFIKPRVREMYARVHELGLRVFIHSCGDIAELFPDLVEMGVDVVNPVQPEVMDLQATKDEFGRHITLYGGLGAQSVLPAGTPEEVIAHAVAALRLLGRGGGYIFGNAGAFSTDTPLANVLALVAVAEDQPGYLSR